MEGWENHEPAPIEFMHSKMLELFHELRNQRNELERQKTNLELNGVEFNKLIAKAKMLTYEKYPKQVSSKAILKTEL